MLYLTECSRATFRRVGSLSSFRIGGSSMSQIYSLRGCVRLVLLLGSLVFLAGRCIAQDDVDEQRQAQIVQRFVAVLEKNPRRGTAFDKIYGHHVERGTLEKFAQQLRDR